LHTAAINGISAANRTPITGLPNTRKETASTATHDRRTHGYRLSPTKRSVLAVMKSISTMDRASGQQVATKSPIEVNIALTFAGGWPALGVPAAHAALAAST